MMVLDGYHLHRVTGLRARLVFGLVCMGWVGIRGKSYGDESEVKGLGWA